MKVLFSVVTLITMTFTSVAQAQMWGAGVYGGAQACGSMQEREPEGVRDARDAIDEIKNRKKELKDEVKDLEKDKRDAQEDYNDATRNIQRVLRDNSPEDQGVNAYQAAMDHMTGVGTNVTDNTQQFAPSTICSGTQAAANQREPWTGYCQQAYGTNPPEENFGRDFASVVQNGAGIIDPQICYKEGTLVKPSMVRRDNYQSRCSTAIRTLPTLHRRLTQIEDEYNQKKAELELLEEDLKEARRDLKREQRQARRDREDGDTEAGYCPDGSCYQQPHVSTTQQIGSLLLGGLGAYLGYKGAQSIRKTNANLGWPTHPGLAVGAAMPGVMFGIYGATYGFGNQACNGMYPPWGMGGPGGLYGPGGYPMGGGAFGYPGGYGGLAGGGLFMPGYGGYPYGGGYGGFPAGGMIAGGIVGAIGGMYAPYAGGMYMGGMAPYAGGGMYMGGMAPYAGGMMAPYSGGAFAGGIVGAIGGMYMGGMAPYAGGGMYMGGMAPYAGGPVLPYPAGGAFAGGIGGAYAPYAGGMYAPYAGGIAGALGGGYPLAPYAGGAMGGGFAGMQYQQAMLQQQQAMLQYQMQAQQDYMNRQQMVGRLTSQMYQIQMQIQQISSGVYGGGYGSGGFGGSIGGGFGTGGPAILPYPSTGLPGTGGTVDPNLNQTPIPSRGF